MSFPPETFDAVYAIEATVHAASLKGVYSEIFKVLKPGGVFGVYEWFMTDAYDNDNPRHRSLRLTSKKATESPTWSWSLKASKLSRMLVSSFNITKIWQTARMQSHGTTLWPGS